MRSWGKILVIGVFASAGVIAVTQWVPSRNPSSASVAVTVPADLSPQAHAGKTEFDANCARCHGANGAGTDHGPPFVHIIYNPGHHPDQVFFLAAKIGVRVTTGASATCRRSRRSTSSSWRTSSPTCERCKRPTASFTSRTECKDTF